MNIKEGRFLKRSPLFFVIILLSLHGTISAVNKNQQTKNPAHGVRRPQAEARSQHRYKRGEEKRRKSIAAYKAARRSQQSGDASKKRGERVRGIQLGKKQRGIHKRENPLQKKLSKKRDKKRDRKTETQDKIYTYYSQSNRLAAHVFSLALEIYKIIALLPDNKTINLSAHFIAVIQNSCSLLGLSHLFYPRQAIPGTLVRRKSQWPGTGGPEEFNPVGPGVKDWDAESIGSEHSDNSMVPDSHMAYKEFMTGPHKNKALEWGHILGMLAQNSANIPIIAHAGEQVKLLLSQPKLTERIGSDQEGVAASRTVYIISQVVLLVLGSICSYAENRHLYYRKNQLYRTSNKTRYHLVGIAAGLLFFVQKILFYYYQKSTEYTQLVPGSQHVDLIPGEVAAGLERFDIQEREFLVRQEGASPDFQYQTGSFNILKSGESDISNHENKNEISLSDSPEKFEEILELDSSLNIDSGLSDKSDNILSKNELNSHELLTQSAPGDQEVYLEYISNSNEHDLGSSNSFILSFITNLVLSFDPERPEVTNSISGGSLSQKTEQVSGLSSSLYRLDKRDSFDISQNSTSFFGDQNYQENPDSYSVDHTLDIPTEISLNRDFIYSISRHFNYHENLFHPLIYHEEISNSDHNISLESDNLIDKIVSDQSIYNGYSDQGTSENINLDTSEFAGVLEGVELEINSENNQNYYNENALYYSGEEGVLNSSIISLFESFDRYNFAELEQRGSQEYLDGLGDQPESAELEVTDESVKPDMSAEISRDMHRGSGGYNQEIFHNRGEVFLERENIVHQGVLSALKDNKTSSDNYSYKLFANLGDSENTNGAILDNTNEVAYHNIFSEDFVSLTHELFYKNNLGNIEHSNISLEDKDNIDDKPAVLSGEDYSESFLSRENMGINSSRDTLEPREAQKTIQPSAPTIYSLAGEHFISHDESKQEKIYCESVPEKSRDIYLEENSENNYFSHGNLARGAQDSNNFSTQRVSGNIILAEPGVKNYISGDIHEHGLGDIERLAYRGVSSSGDSEITSEPVIMRDEHLAQDIIYSDSITHNPDTEFYQLYHNVPDNNLAGSYKLKNLDQDNFINNSHIYTENQGDIALCTLEHDQVHLIKERSQEIASHEDPGEITVVSEYKNIVTPEEPSEYNTDEIRIYLEEDARSRIAELAEQTAYTREQAREILDGYREYLESSHNYSEPEIIDILAQLEIILTSSEELLTEQIEHERDQLLEFINS